MGIICDRCGAPAVDCDDQGYYLCEACLAFEENFGAEEGDRDADEEFPDEKNTDGSSRQST